jgi:plastocyanin
VPRLSVPASASWPALTALGVLFAIACGSGGGNAKTTPTAPGGATVKATTFTVQIDGQSPSFNAQLSRYYPRELTVHPGDTIQFKVVDSGEPHTVTLGTLVDSAVAAIEKAGARPRGAPPLPEVAQLPQLLAVDARDANQAAANPCFLDTGAPPADGPCPKRQQPELNGVQTFYNSGWLAPDAVFVVKLAKDIKPGAYGLIDLDHAATMNGKITVVDGTQAIPGPEEVARQGAKELNDLIAAIQPSADASAALPLEKAIAGVTGPGIAGAGAAQFGPKELTIPVGGSITWIINGRHTISFNAPEDAKGLRLKAADGTLHLNSKLTDRVNSPPIPAVAPEVAANAAAPPALIDAGDWDGSGLRNSGIIASQPAGIYAYKLTFTKAGAYQFKCLIHDKMEGTVKVGS